ncbi:electron transfer flavoprotein subunit alpha/FixB family protein [Aquirufa sp. OSTEICH-129V]|uniref:Electron transfer flavoprotein subunit alpha/FixB family protein n=1 Tax=Aquirufa avitistagni TaxID=3104728 RepID=A0ABW6DA33_9BACT
MNNVALFVDFKNGRLSKKSSNLLSKVIQLNFDQITLYTFKKSKEYFLSADINTELVLVDLNSSVSITDNELVAILSNDLSKRKIKVGFAIKSLLIDNLIPQLAISLKSTVKSQILDFEMTGDQYCYTTSVFNNKAIAQYIGSLNSCFYIVTNNLKLATSPQEKLNEIAITPDILPIPKSNYTVKSIDKVENEISLNDAEIVVGAGRGLKDPNNWDMIEELASLLNAATACSKPVSDLDWRPHHEHVGQTGVKISPNIYIACGISGAIQHLAGVNSSKTIVVINNDKEAPFFNNADYGIVGDVFEIVPRLINKLRNR